MIVYFSGTGNSRFAAEILACRLGDELLDAGRLIKLGERPEIQSEKPWVFVCPTYAWRIPRIFESFIKETAFSGSRDAYFLLTCGSDTGDAAEYAKKLCDEKKFNFRGMQETVMPENYIAMFPVPSKEKSVTITEKAVPVIHGAADHIASGRDIPTKNASAADKVKSGAVNEKFYRLFVKDKLFSADDKCIGCGICASACVLNNIRIESGRPVWGGNCTHCMACICGCPKEAIEYGKRSRGKRRYKCPDVVIK